MRRRWLKGKQDPASPLSQVRVRRLSPAAIRVLTRDTALDPRFRSTDRHLWRWSVSQGSGMALEQSEAEKLPVSRPTPLPDDEAVLVDLVVLASPTWARDFAFMWYRSDKSADQIAKELKIPRRTVFEERRLVLAYFFGRLTEVGIRLPVWEPDS